ncbi:histidinol-phosphate aminotransferase family protein [Campylobacter vulpis]|nr:histidinol-phosphate transaminase [Campylobacter vulpis]MBS4252733.1 histidinol-phosphate aminotransferase family protein [Campylobacter vulpis]MBS4282024.1 histidinol-phosphate aminotransferase family protein [Campylobacter vulpis]MBS4331891.1 histidinol-phosphate aminotransferase family protein [Campylobacter vulpis]MBS4407245.1 histidinol-phosphate aminotransferase family protein [Campylobacter vulpis]MBS4439933.1 histidinol-phosphate aminotransferase family protein [Campylobacter vulpis
MIKLNEKELSIANEIKRLKDEAGSHSPSIFTLMQKLSQLDIKVDACFLSNPYATDLFLRYFDEELIKTYKLRDFLEFYPSQNRVIAEVVSQAVNVDAKNIFIGNGAIEIIQAVMHRFVYDKIVVCIPTFSSYYEFAKKDTQVIFYQLDKEKDYALDLDDYVGFIKENRPQSIVLINPNNPNGGGFINKMKLKQLLSELSFVENIILDTSFIHFAYENDAFDLINLEELCKEFKNLIIIKSMSKDFGIAGIRVGYGIMSEDRVGALLENGYLWNTSGIGEYFLRLYARENFFAEYNELRKNYIHKTQAFFLALAQIEQIKVYPSLANFALIELLDGSLSEDFVAKMLIKYGIYMRTCRDKIGLNGEFVRIASRKFEENEIMIEAMKDCFKG